MDSTSHSLLCKPTEADPASSSACNEDAIVDTQIAGYDDQQIGVGLDSDGCGIRVSEQDIDNMEFSANGPGLRQRGSVSDSMGKGKSELGVTMILDVNGSEWNEDQRGKGSLNLRSGKKILKRGKDSPNLLQDKIVIVENDDDLGNVCLSMDEYSGGAKRSRKTGNEELGKDDSLLTSLDAMRLGSEFERNFLSDPAVHIDGSSSNFVGSRPAEEGDRRGKRKLDLDGTADLLSNFGREAELGLESKTETSADNRNSDINHSADNVASQQRRRDYASIKKEYMMNCFREIAKENAARFAHFAPDKEEDQSSPAPEVEHQIDNGPDTFSKTMKLIKDRGVKSVQTGCVSSERNLHRKNQETHIGARFSVPSLQELCLEILVNNADAIVSLDGVPDALRHRLSQLLCDSRKMNSHFFELLVSGSPTEIRLRDCSWLTEDQFKKSFQACDTANLEVLQLDQCGRCMTDYVLLATLAQSPRQLPRLASLSLSGACRLSDKGLHALISSTPVLRSINLSQCSLLTSSSLNILANSLGSLLKELYLDDCQSIDAAQIVPALKELEHLEVLSVAGIQSVSDEFIKDYIIARGYNMKELVLKDCRKLTDASMKVIAEHCPGLCVLDLMKLCKLTDLSIGYLANSCRALHTLKLCRNSFSDEAIAAFMEITGESLKELSLNSIRKVGHHTALSLASRAKNLHTLDLSWCRNLTDKELRLIVDSCLSLRLLKLFGCTQVRDVFLSQSNPQVQIIGLQMSPVLQHVKVPDPHKGALQYSSVSVNLL